MKEIPVVREALGWIPLVTPTSQIVGFQAVLNVKMGRWKNFSPQAMDVALGYYGKTPAEVDPEVRKLAAEKSGKEPINVRPADLKEPGMDALRNELKEKGLPTDDEHCVIYAMFPSQVEQYHKTKDQPQAEKPKPAPESKAQPAASGGQAATGAASSEGSPSGEPVNGRRMKLHINGKPHDVVVEEID
jgi:oxaloacetate decarboxylase alpha subunit/pyruvate carboxylase subunit B